MATTDKHVQVQVRWTLPGDVHTKIKTFQRKLAAQKDKDVTMDETVSEIVRKSKL